MKRQLELIKEIVKLAEENPDYEIHFAVSNELLSDSCVWTDHKIESVEVEWMYKIDDGIYIGRESIEEKYEYVFGDVCVVQDIHGARMVILVRTEPC